MASTRKQTEKRRSKLEELRERERRAEAGGGAERVERLYEQVGLPPTMPAAASRVAVPVYAGGRQAGKATTTTWSPTLKKLIALATVRREHARVGARVEIEMTVEAVRHRVAATVVKTPFFNPKRKTATPVA